jgi:hypothetical protein
MHDTLTEAEVVRWIGADRLARLKAGGWLSPGYSFEGFEGTPAYQADYVRLRFEEDKRSHPGGRGSAVVRKAPARRGGAPEVVIDRDGVRHVVVRKVVPPAAAGRLSPGVKAELQGLLALARRVLAGRR